MKVYILDVNLNTLENTVTKLLDEASGGWTDKHVLLKPNLIGPFPPERGATTHPHLVRAFVKALKERGAHPVVTDSPGGLVTSLQHTAQVSGIAEAVGDFLCRLDKPGVERLIPTVEETVLIHPILFETDFVINMPRCKTHALTGISGAIKNMFGMVMGGMKAQLHLSAVSTKRFCQVLLDVYQLRIPDLHVMDALTVMEGNGPTQGHLRPLNKVLVSENGVALDTMIAAMMGFEPEELDLLAYAEARKLGPISLEKIEIQGEWQPLAGFVKPGPYALTLRERSRILAGIGNACPVLVTDLCDHCGKCAESCPAGAITLEPDPVIETAYCVACYCCTELCPTGAMHVPYLPALWGSLL
jgi:uncharacterized protein (DUF362 family)/Pyruvate/2-oxoacid:ferredoxin oxidoreductase delta subunit